MVVSLVRKNRAVRLRKKGLSIPAIEKRLGIRRSTLSFWFRDVKLSKTQKDRLRANWRTGLVHARTKAVLWHNEQKRNRLAEAENEASKTLSRINTKNIDIVELAFAALYFGEGAKKNPETAIGSSDPLILRFALSVLKKVYGLDLSAIRCDLYLRADQIPEKEIEFWTNELGVSASQFQNIQIDPRTKGRKTFVGYHGVCNLRCSHVAIQRKLMYLSRAFFNEVANTYLRP